MTIFLPHKSFSKILSHLEVAENIDFFGHSGACKNKLKKDLI